MLRTSRCFSLWETGKETSQTASSFVLNSQYEDYSGFLYSGLMPLKHGLGRECMNVSGDSHLKLMEQPSVRFDLCALTRHQAFEIKC